MAGMQDYGIQIFRNGIVFHSDRRWRHRVYLTPGMYYNEMKTRPKSNAGKRRGVIKAFSRASSRRLAFVLANAMTQFRTFITLTYHAQQGPWEDVPERNKRIVEDSKKDLRTQA